MNPTSEVFVLIPKCEESPVEERNVQLDAFSARINSYVQNTLEPMVAIITISRQDQPKNKWVTMPIRDENNKIDPMVGRRDMAKQILDKVREQGFKAKLCRKVEFSHGGACPSTSYLIKILDMGRV